MRSRAIALVLCVQTGGEFDALFVQQERIFERAAREKSFGESGQKDDIETAAARFFDGADEDPAVAALGRFGAEESQAFGEHVIHFVERSGAHLAHRFQLAQNAEHGLGAAQRHLRELGQAVQPDAPLFRGWEGAESVNQWKGKMFQTFQLLNAVVDVGATRIVFFFQIAQLGLQFGAKAAQTAGPTVAATDDGGIHQQLFPADGDIERSGVFGLRSGQGRREGRSLERRQDLVIGGDPLRGTNARRAVGIREAASGRAKDIRRSATRSSLRWRRPAARERRGRRDRDARRRG